MVKKIDAMRVIIKNDALYTMQKIHDEALKYFEGPGKTKKQLLDRCFTDSNKMDAIRLSTLRLIQNSQLNESDRVALMRNVGATYGMHLNSVEDAFAQAAGPID